MFTDTDRTVFVERDAAGAVKAFYRHRLIGIAEEEVLETNAEVIAYVQAQIAKQQSVNVQETERRSREDSLEDLRRAVRNGASQEQINEAIINLLN